MNKRITILAITPTEYEQQYIHRLAETLKQCGNEITILQSRNKGFIKNELRHHRPSILHAIGKKGIDFALRYCEKKSLPLAITVPENHSLTEPLKKHCARGNLIFAINESAKHSLIINRICNSKRIFLADDIAATQKVYTKNIDILRPLDYMISGYYGRNNFGDNLTLNRLMEHLKDYRGTVLTCDFSNTDVPAGVHLIHRFDLLKIRKAMKRTKVFLFGSGSILQDATSSRSLFYYYFIMKMALHYHCKTMLYANGIGPINHPKNRKNIARILKRIDLLTIRDQDSIDLLHQLQPDQTAHLTQDDAFSYNIDSVQSIPLGENAKGRTVVGVNFKFSDSEDPKIRQIAEALKELSARHNLYYLLIPYHLSQDLAPMRELLHLLGDCAELSTASYDPDMLIRYAANCKFQIVERLHGQIVSSMLGQPFLPIDYDPKTKSFAMQTKMDRYLLNHNTLDKNSLLSTFERVLADHSKIRDHLATFSAKAKKDAAKNREYLYEIINNF